MDFNELKKDLIKTEIGVDAFSGDRIYSFIDFANVSNWFNDDNQTSDNRPLRKGERNIIHILKLKELAYSFSEKVKIYYGQDLQKLKSRKFTDLLRIVFDNKNVVTKDLQRIRYNQNGKLIEIRKCNFDVEIAVDAMKMIEYYDTFCIFSGDADFVYLNNFLKKKGKKIIVVKSGHITKKLKESADLIINAQDLKRHIIITTS